MNAATQNLEDLDAMVALMGGERVLYMVDNFTQHADDINAHADYLGERAALYIARNGKARTARAFDWSAKWELEALTDGTGVAVKIFEMEHYERADGAAPVLVVERRTPGAVRAAQFLIDWADSY
jgi:hypothetical protein